MTMQSNGLNVPIFNSYEDIKDHLQALQEEGVTPDSIIILTPPPHG